ncbi:MAG: type II toxin-antitoxin system RelE/ParE family toxin [Pseudomonadota bacterium]|jgi:putative addiction module killer protein
MNTVKHLPEFDAWFAGLTDEMVRGVILARIKRLESGIFGDVAPVGDGVSELRIHLGPGWRIYFAQHGKQIIVLLGGGTKARKSATSGEPNRSQND